MIHCFAEPCKRFPAGEKGECRLHERGTQQHGREWAGLLRQQTELWGIIMPKLDLQKNRGREEAGWPGLNIYEKAKEMLSSSEYPPDFIEFLASKAQERADEIYRELEEEQRKQEKSEQRRKEKKRKRTEKQRTAGLLAMFSRFFALREKSRKILLKMYEKDEADYEVHRQEEDFSQFQELAFMSPEASEAAKKIFLVLKYHPDAHRVLEKPWKAAEPNFARLSQCDDFSDFVDHLSWWNSEFLPDAEVSYFLHAIVADGQLPADKAGRYALRETEDEHEYFQWKDFLHVDGIDGSKAVAKELASIYGTPISILQFANLGTFAEEYLFPALMQSKLDPAEPPHPVRRHSEGVCRKDDWGLYHVRSQQEGRRGGEMAY